MLILNRSFLRRCRLPWSRFLPLGNNWGVGRRRCFENQDDFTADGVELIFALVYPIGMTIGILLPIPFVDALILITLFLVPTLIYVAIHNKNVPDTGRFSPPTT